MIGHGALPFTPAWGRHTTKHCRPRHRVSESGRSVQVRDRKSSVKQAVAQGISPFFAMSKRNEGLQGAVVDKRCKVNEVLRGRAPKTFNNDLSFDPGIWRTKTRYFQLCQN